MNRTKKLNLQVGRCRLKQSYSRKLQQEYFRYFNKYKEVLSSADVEMLMRQESASKGKQKELLSILLGLLEALQMK